MSLTVNKNIARGLNTLGYWVGTFFGVTPDNSYPTGGYSFPANIVKLGFLEYMAPIFCPNTARTAGVWAVYDQVNLKLQFFWAEAAGGTASITLTGGQAPGIAVQVTPDSSSGVLGKTTAGDITFPITLTGAGGPLVEVPNATDLSDYYGVGVAFGRG